MLTKILLLCLNQLMISIKEVCKYPGNPSPLIWVYFFVVDLSQISNMAVSVFASQSQESAT